MSADWFRFALIHGPMLGFLNANKPSGVSSRAVVTAVEKLAPGVKAGHAGTLDPLADGVLVIGLGRATKLIDRVQSGEKHYRGEFLLGRTSPTEDLEGEVRLIENPAPPSLESLISAAAGLVGWIEQLPPAFSALKVNGRRAYKLARRGKEVQLSPRRVLVRELSIVEYDYPRLVLDVTCGKGVYIRSLGRDLALAVGDHAVMSGLTRTRVGPFRLEHAVDVRNLDASALADSLTSAAVAVPDLPQVVVTEEEVAYLFAGRFLPNRFELTGAEAAAVDASGELVSLLEVRGDQVKPALNFFR